ncbi:hypothetical protein OAD06_02280 [Flavobacteriaceae bacterium]|nr:hypothetical protein [Flavobacteriaceae bacterium]
MYLVKEIFKYLNVKCNYAVLRNFTGLPNNINSRDIDILIDRNDFKSSINTIVNIIVDSEFKILTYFKSDRMVTFVCASANKNKVEIIQFDFLFQTSLYGLMIISADTMLKSRKFNGEIYHVSKEYQFLDKYLYLMLLNASYPEKYKDLKLEMSQNILLNNILLNILGLSSLEEVENTSYLKLRKSILSLNLKRKPLRQLEMLFSFFYYNIKNKLFYKGFSVGFTGPDGAGKTTIIDDILKELKKVYTEIQFFHFRPRILPNLGESVQKTKLKSEIDIDYSNPHRGKKTGILNSSVRLIYYTIDYIIGYFKIVRPFLQKRSIVIFDRYFTDTIADSRRSRIYLNPKLLYWFGKIFIPKLDYNVLLTADTTIILARKQELTAEGIDNINEKLDYLSKKKGYYLVLNNGTAEEAINKILNIIFEKQHFKNIKIFE